MKLFGNDNESTRQFQTDFFSYHLTTKRILVDDVLGTFRAVRSDANQVVCWIGATFFAFTGERLDFPYALSTLSLRATFPPIAWKKRTLFAVMHALT